MSKNPGDKHHLTQMAKLELMFHKDLGIDEFYKELIKFIDKNIPLAEGRPLTIKELLKVDDFTKSYFLNKTTVVERWITRAFVLGMLVEKRERMPQRPAIDIEQLPVRIKDAVKKYSLSPTETRALEWSHYQGGRSLVNATNDTTNRVGNLLFENLKEAKGHRAFRKALEEELFTDKGESGRNWKRVAISETNTALNQGYLATLKHGEFAMGYSMPDACDYCATHIKGKVYMVIDPNRVDLDYENLDPRTAKYRQISYIYSHAIWVGKSNIGRSSSPRKRKDPDIGNTPDNLEPREHHERWSPITPAHTRCRCRVIRINPDTMFVKDGKLEMKVMDEAGYKQWYERTIKPIKEQFELYGIKI